LPRQLPFGGVIPNETRSVWAIIGVLGSPARIVVEPEGHSVGYYPNKAA
jgi:hypothetical protein